MGRIISGKGLSLYEIKNRIRMKQLPRCYAVLWAFSLLLLSARLSAQAGLLEKVENMALVDRVKP